MEFRNIEIETHDHVAVVRLARPPVNAIDQDLYRAIRDVFGDVANTLPGARAVVLTGQGAHFCGGNDLREFETLAPDNAAARMLEVREAFWAIHDAPIPVIGAVHGSALGTGLALAASCDFVVAAEGAVLGLPEVSVGVMGGASHLARLVPQPLVRWMFFSAEPMPVERIAACGGILEVVPAKELTATALERAARIARHSPVVLRYAKQSLNAIEGRDLKAGYEIEQGLTELLSAHPDSKEAVRAFFERREPRY